MDALEIIGFLIMVLVLASPFLRRMIEKRMKMRDPEGYARDKKAAEEARIREIRKMMGLNPTIIPNDDEEEPAPAVFLQEELPQEGGEEPVFFSDAHEGYTYYEEGRSTVFDLMHHASGQDMVMLSEIFSPPLSLREHDRDLGASARVDP